MSCMQHHTTCVWCHEWVEYDPANVKIHGWPHCQACGHLSVNRTNCDCEKCATPALLTVEEARAELLRRRGVA